MTGRIFAKAAALAVCLAACSAAAETSLITRAGAWQAFGGTTTSGRPVCGVSQSAGERYFGLKYYSGDSTFTVQMGAKSWRIENGARENLQMILDGNRPWTATGTGMHFNDGDGGVEFAISRDKLDQFAVEFRNSSLLRVQFGSRGSAEWTFSLSGSSAVSGAFLQCIEGLTLTR